MKGTLSPEPASRLSEKAEKDFRRSLGPHRAALLVITVLAIVTRFLTLGHPSEVIFDEVHIMKFVSRYINRTYFFDVHPPFGRLLYAFTAWIAGYTGNFVPRMVGESYVEYQVPYIALRSVAALLSSLTIPVIYLTLQESGCGVPACAVAAGLVLFDTAQLSMTRTIYLDAILGLSVVCSLLSYIKFAKLKDEAMSARWWRWLLLTGIALSCSISTKFTGVFTFVVIGSQVVADLWELYDLRNPRSVDIPSYVKHFAARFVALLIIPLALYLLWFWIHFAILTRSGGYSDNYMSDEFQQTLQNTALGGTPKTLPFFRKFLELQSLMFKNTVAVPRGHPYESRPYQWPIFTGGIAYWCSDESRQEIYFLENIPGWWTASSSVVLLSALIALDQLYEGRKMRIFQSRMRSFLYKTGAVLVFAWALHYFPFYLMMGRQLMLHSYLPAHLLSTLVAGALVELLDSWLADEAAEKTAQSEKTSQDKPSHRPREASVTEARRTQKLFAGSAGPAWLACAVILLATFLFWCFWFPMTYGWPALSNEAVRRREILGVRLVYSHNTSKCFP